MDLKTLRKRLAAEASAAGICRQWLEKIKRAHSREYLLQLFIKGLDFAILNDFPSDKLAAEFNDIAPAFGIYINRQGSWRADGKKRVIARDAIVSPATFKGFSVGEVYALHGSGVEIKAGGYAIVCITAEADAQVDVKASGHAKICITNHGAQIRTRKEDGATIKITTT